MRWIVLTAALGLTACTGFELNPPPPAMIKADAAHVTDPREIVALVPEAASAARLLKGASAQGFVLREENDLNALNLKMQRYTIPEPLDGPGAIAALETIAPRSPAGVNHAYKPAAASLDYAGTLMAWPAPACRAQGPVGMLDTAIDATIPELSGVTIHQAAFQRGSAAGPRHGTEVASVLADPRRLTGVTLYNAAVIGRSARGQQESGVDSMLEALDWMAANGVRLGNISLAGPYFKLLDRGIDVAAARGMTIVAAVGNDGAASNPRYPAALDNVIAVTAVDANKSIYRDAVRGSLVDVAAPGVDVMISMGGRTHFATGTSIATPFVTARLASAPALFKAGTGAVRKALTRTAVDLGDPGADPVFGAGLAIASASCSPG